MRPNLTGNRPAGCDTPEAPRPVTPSVEVLIRLLAHAGALSNAETRTPLGLQLAGAHLQRMKSKWGSCNPRAGTIRLNTELVKKPKDLLEYVIVHEMLHLIAPTHSERFLTLMSKHYPSWREARAELNELPLGAESWRQ